MKRIWIKLYLEILDDDEFGTLPEFTKWRAIELFLVAGENGDDGRLPPVERLAWRLRLPQEKLEETLSALEQVGVVGKTPEGWMVTNFKKRQYSEGYERVKRYRNGKCNANVTEKESSSTSNSDSDSLNEEGGMGGETPEEVNLRMFTDVLGKFYGDKEKKRWLILVESVGMDRAQELIDWANKKEINMVNRPSLLDSLETAAKKWRENSASVVKGSRAQLLKDLEKN